MAQPSKNKKKTWKKASAADKRIARPCTPEALAACGQLKTPPPSSPFDPSGLWRQSYYIWMSGGPWQSYRGALTLERSPNGREAFSLTVKQELLADRMRAIHETTATIQCRADVLGTPMRWRLRSRVYDVKTNKDFADATVEQSGKLIPGGVEIATNGRKTVEKITGNWTSNWSLFEVVRRLPRAGMAPIPFTLLEDLDIVKLNYRLTYRGHEQLTFAGVKVQTTRYDQIGQGCLPCVYYVDDKGRMVLAHTALRAYILDENVSETHQQKVNALVRKEMK